VRSTGKLSLYHFGEMRGEGVYVGFLKFIRHVMYLRDLILAILRDCQKHLTVLKTVGKQGRRIFKCSLFCTKVKTETAITVSRL
jgi:hypothetical protein